MEIKYEGILVKYTCPNCGQSWEVKEPIIKKNVPLTPEEISELESIKRSVLDRFTIRIQDHLYGCDPEE